MPQRQKQFSRNKQLEGLLHELNGLLAPVEADVVQGFKEPNYPVVLLVGCARSGTTLIMQWLARTEEFAYPTNLLSRFYAAPYIGAKIQQMMFDPKYSFRDEFVGLGGHITFESELGKTTGALAPNEFYYFWRRFFPYGETQYLDESALQQVDGEGFVAELAALESVFDKPLAMKGLMLNWNIPFLASLLPRALFLYVRREPVYNAQSLLESRQKFFGDRQAWYSFKPRQYDRLKGLGSHEQVAGQVYFTNRAIRRGLEQVESSRWLKIDYESFCESPEVIYERIEDKLVLQGKQINPNYAGPMHFDSTNEIRLSRDEFDRLAAAYEEFGDAQADSKGAFL